jgi:hypothetical protein
LKFIPSESVIYPQPFVEGFRADLEKINNTVQSKLSHFGDTVREWDTFMKEEAPQTDDAEQFHKDTKPLYIPFREELFGLGVETEVFSYDNFVRRQKQADSATLASQNSSFGKLKVYQTCPSMQFTKNCGSPIPIAPGNTLDAALQHVNEVVAKKKTKSKESSREHSKSTWVYEEAKRPELPSEKSCYWDLIGKAFIDKEDSLCYTIVSVVAGKKRLQKLSKPTELYYKYVLQTKYMTMKDISDNEAFEFSLCESFFSEESDFEFLDKSIAVCGSRSRQTLEDDETANKVKASNNEKKRKRRSSKGSFAYVAVPLVAEVTEARCIPNGEERSLRKRKKNINNNID